METDSRMPARRAGEGAMTIWLGGQNREKVGPLKGHTWLIHTHQHPQPSSDFAQSFFFFLLATLINDARNDGIVEPQQVLGISS
jgi:hypothetical protein